MKLDNQKNLQFPGITEYTTQNLLWFKFIPLTKVITFQLHDGSFWYCKSVGYAYRNQNIYINGNTSTLVNNGIEVLRNDIDNASKILCKGFGRRHLYDGAFYEPKGVPKISFSVYNNDNCCTGNIQRKSNKKYLLASLY